MSLTQAFVGGLIGVRIITEAIVVAECIRSKVLSLLIKLAVCMLSYCTLSLIR